MMPYWSEAFGNPSSPHGLGADAESVLRRCRQLGLKLLSGGQGQLLFTSGGTESNNLAIQGSAGMAVQPGHLITTAIEHASVAHTMEHLERLGWEVTVLPADGFGHVNPKDLRHALRPETRLVSIMWVNNEVGSVQPMEALVAIIRQYNQEHRLQIRLHVDGVQALCRIPMDLSSLGADMVSFSGHKIGGPKGTGLLWLRQGLTIRPLFFGGGQEHGLRSGTENMPGIVGITKALQLVTKEQPDSAVRWHQLRELLWQKVSSIPEIVRTSPNEGAPHILHVCFPKLPGEVFSQALSDRGVCVSTGSACSSHGPRSTVLTAMGIKESIAQGAIRFSFGEGVSQEAVEEAAQITREVAAALRSAYGRE